MGQEEPPKMKMLVLIFSIFSVVSINAEAASKLKLYKFVLAAADPVQPDATEVANAEHELKNQARKMKVKESDLALARTEIKPIAFEKYDGPGEVPSSHGVEIILEVPLSTLSN
jgi:hypothetical protein